MRLMTVEQRELARHALGLPNRNKTSYRNRYVCNESHPVWSELVRLGLATMRPAHTVPFGGCALFYLTEDGAKLALDKGEKLCREFFPRKEG